MLVTGGTGKATAMHPAKLGANIAITGQRRARSGRRGEIRTATGLTSSPGTSRSSRWYAGLSCERCKWLDTPAAGVGEKALPGVSSTSAVKQGGEGLVPASTVASPEELEIARELVASARVRGVALTGLEGLVKALTKTVVETALDEELADHLGYGKHDPAGRNGQNSRNGKRTKTVLTDTPRR